MTLRINCWSGPRNVSTALMRSFGQRFDSRVVDEPLYGHYLATAAPPHPRPPELLAQLETDAEIAIRDTILGPCDRPMLYCKQMAHHLIENVPLGWLAECLNVLLIRDPVEVLSTIVRDFDQPTMRDVGFARQVQLLDELRAMGQEPPVIDARELLFDPAAVLEQLCDRVGIAYDPAMLHWPAGPRPEDGPWAPYWYANVHSLTGFAPYRPKTNPFPEQCRELLTECRPLYEQLLALAIRAPR